MISDPKYGFAEANSPRRQLVRFMIQPKPVYEKTVVKTDAKNETCIMSAIDVKRPKGFVDTIYIQVVNSLNDVICMEATEEHFAKFKDAWEEFQLTPAYRQYIAQAEDPNAIYTPLESITLSPSMIKLLTMAGIRSVEDLEQASDEKLVGIKGAVLLRNQVRLKRQHENSKSHTTSAAVTV
jgi:hypothetical protein